MNLRFVYVVMFFIFIPNLMAGGSYSFALVNMNMDYREYDENNNLLDSEKASSIVGWEVGYKYNFNYSVDRSATIGLQTSFFSGYTDYEGSELVSGKPIKSSSYENISNIGLSYLEDMRFKNFDLLYGFEGGYHYWYRELSSIQSELYSWLYFSPIIGVQKEINDDFIIKLLLKYKYAIDPTMKANSFSQEFKLGTTDTIELHIPVIYRFDDSINFFVEYMLSQQNISKSNSISGYIDGKYYTTIHEPDSKENDQYIKFGVAFKY